MKKEYEQLKEMIENSDSIVFFGGAGVSTESGIKDFRGKGGFYTDDSLGISPAEILSQRYFLRHPDKFYDYYRKNMIPEGIKPNPAHYALAMLEDMGKLKAVITQNIDGLHQMAGSRTVYEVHGSVSTNHCISCKKSYPLSIVTETDNVPYCNDCGGLIHPDIVLYGEPLDAETWYRAEEAIMTADLLIVAGTSLLVEPAASLERMYQGEKTVIINKTPTPRDEFASLVIRDPVGAVLGEVIKHII